MSNEQNPFQNKGETLTEKVVSNIAKSPSIGTVLNEKDESSQGEHPTGHNVPAGHNESPPPSPGGNKSQTKNKNVTEGTLTFNSGARPGTNTHPGTNPLPGSPSSKTPVSSGNRRRRQDENKANAGVNPLPGTPVTPGVSPAGGVPSAGTIVSPPASLDPSHVFTPPESLIPQSEQVQLDAQNSITTQLGVGNGEAKHATVGEAMVRATEQATKQNSEEYQTVAINKGRHLMQDMSIFSLQTSYHNAHQNSINYFDSALDYSKQFGGIHSLEQQGKALMANLESHGVSTPSMDFSQFSEFAGKSYADTVRENDGLIHLAGEDASPLQGVSLATTLAAEDGADTTGATLIEDLGDYHDRYESMQKSVKILSGSDNDATRSTFDAWTGLVGGNYQALDKRHHLVETYNAYQIDHGLSHKTIRNFTGTKEQVEQLRSLMEKEDSPFTDLDVSALDDCVKACGFNEPPIDGFMVSAANASKRRLATGLLDDTQSAGVGVLTGAYRAGKTASFVHGSISDYKDIKKANKLEKDVNKLIDKTSRTGDLGGSEYQKAKEKLDKLKEKLGVQDNSALRNKVTESQVRAAEKKAARKRIRAATSKLDKKEAKLAMAKLKNEEHLAKYGKYSSRLSKKTSKLSRQVTKLQASKASALSGKVVRLITDNPITRAAGTLQRIRHQIIMRIIKALAPIAGMFFLLAAVLSGLVATVVVITAPFACFDSNTTDGEGDVENDLQYVNEQMSLYEDDEIEAMSNKIRNVVEEEYAEGSTPNSSHPWVSSPSDDMISWEFMGRDTPTVSTVGYVVYEGKERPITGYYIRHKDKKGKVSYDEITEEEALSRNSYWVSFEIGEDVMYVKTGKSRVTSPGCKGLPKLEVDYDCVDEYQQDSILCNCMQLMSVYRYYYEYLNSDNMEMQDTNFWRNQFKGKYLQTAWQKTHSVVKTKKAKEDNDEGKTWGEFMADMTYDQLQVVGTVKGTGLKFHTASNNADCDNWGHYRAYILTSSGEVISEEHECCFGHINAGFHCRVESDIETILAKNRCKASVKAEDGSESVTTIPYKELIKEGIFGHHTPPEHDGGEWTPYVYDSEKFPYQKITGDKWKQIFPEMYHGMAYDILGDYYHDKYAPGLERYADFGVYFGAAEQTFTEEQIEKIIEAIQEEYGELSEKQIAILKTALKGCGRFLYGSKAEMYGHSLDTSKKGAPGGHTDCSGFVSWVHNNCEQYHNESLLYTTQMFAQAGTESFSFMDLPPGTALVRGDKSTGAAYGAGGASTGTGNHIVIYMGRFKWKSDKKQTFICDCTTGSANKGSSFRTADVSRYKTALLPEKCGDVW